MSAAPRVESRRTKTAGEKLVPAAGILLAHVLPFTLLLTGTTHGDWIAFAVMYVVTNYALGLALHRYFAHRSFRTSRIFQFGLGLLACCVFGDPVGFAGKHRLHHKYSDTDEDVHSPRQGLWQCWIGSLLDDGRTEGERLRMARDWMRYPELMWLHRFYLLPGLALAALLWAIGGYRMFVTGYCLGFLVAVHAPSAVNYCCHRGSLRRYDTGDLSTNNILLGIILFGEGWHNNHHRYPGSARSGVAWYELDLHYYTVKLLSLLGVVWHVRVAPQRAPGARTEGVLSLRSLGAGGD
jgi:stearoyl-CoA desaturase (Delta-9 desaturase)